MRFVCRNRKGVAQRAADGDRRRGRRVRGWNRDVPGFVLADGTLAPVVAAKFRRESMCQNWHVDCSGRQAAAGFPLLNLEDFCFPALELGWCGIQCLASPARDVVVRARVEAKVRLPFPVLAGERLALELREAFLRRLDLHRHRASGNQHLGQ